MPQCLSNTFKMGRIGLAEVQPVPDTPRYTRASVQSSKLQLQPERLKMLLLFLHPAAIYFSTCGHFRGKMSRGDGCWRRRILLLVFQHLDFGERRWVFDFFFFCSKRGAPTFGNDWDERVHGNAKAGGPPGARKGCAHIQWGKKEGESGVKWRVAYRRHARAARIPTRRPAQGWVWIKEEWGRGGSHLVGHHGNFYQEKNDEEPSLWQVWRKTKTGLNATLADGYSQVEMWQRCQTPPSSSCCKGESKPNKINPVKSAATRSPARADTIDLHTHLFVPHICANLYFGFNLRTSTAGNKAEKS